MVVKIYKKLVLTIKQYYAILNTSSSQKQKKEKSMDTSHTAGIEAVTLSEILGLDTWNRERTSEDLQSFIERRHAALEDSDQNFDI